MKEKAQLVVKDKMAKENDKSVLGDIAEQSRVTEADINAYETIDQKQAFLFDTLSAQQKKAIEALEKQQKELDNEQLSLLDQESQLQTKVRQLKQANQEKVTKNRKLESEIKRLDMKTGLMEKNIQKVVEENMEQYELYQGILSQNNDNIDKLREDFGNFQKQNF